jgi:hypothetical protein
MERGVSGRSLALRTVAAAFLLAVALLLAAAGHDVLAWSGQNERGDVAVARVSSDPNVWQPRTLLPAVLSRALVGTSDDVRFNRALQKVQVLRRTGGDPFFPPLLDLAQVQLAFDEIAHGHGPAAVRSRASELHGVLFFQQVLLQGAASGDGGLGALERAIADLQLAVRLDPANTEAQYILEWLLNAYRPIAIERAGQLNARERRRGDTAGGGGSPGITSIAGGF